MLEPQEQVYVGKEFPLFALLKELILGSNPTIGGE